jgi:hypothetical protein
VALISEFGKRYEIDLRVIFYQWPKLGLGLDVEAEIQILKVIYCTPIFIIGISLI